MPEMTPPIRARAGQTTAHSAKGGTVRGWNYSRRRGQGEKYGNTKIEIDGHIFDSRREASRYMDLSLLQKAGEISDLRMQVKYVLIPAQREPDTIGPKGGIKKGKVIEKECSYIADFVYKDKTGKTVVEDVKGFRTKEYMIKRKLMLFFREIRIHEI